MRIILILLTSIFSIQAKAVQGELFPYSVPKNAELQTVSIWKKGARKKFKLTCTGIIIAKNAVLTAAHCFDDQNFIVAIGHREKKIAATKIYLHKQYEKKELYDPYWNYLYDIKIKNDLALIFTNVNFDQQSIASLQTAETNLHERAQFFLSGFGQRASQFGMGDGHGTLRHSDIMYLTEYSASRITIRSGRTGSCQGDSGGPLWMKLKNKWQLIAITSQGDCSTFSLFQRVSRQSLDLANFQMAQSWPNKLLIKLQSLFSI